MPAPLLLGVPVGFWAVVGGATLFHPTVEMTSKAVKSSRSFLMDWWWYYRELSTKQSEDSCSALMFWFMLHPDLIPRSSRMMTVDMMSCTFELPEYNKRFKIDTAYGEFYITILSGDGLQIHGFRIAVERRRYLFGRSRPENLDKLWAFLNEVYGILGIDSAQKPLKPVTRSTNKKYNMRQPEGLANYLNWLIEQKQREREERLRRKMEDSPMRNPFSSVEHSRVEYVSPVGDEGGVEEVKADEVEVEVTERSSAPPTLIPTPQRRSVCTPCTSVFTPCTSVRSPYTPVTSPPTTNSTTSPMLSRVEVVEDEDADIEVTAYGEGIELQPQSSGAEFLHVTSQTTATSRDTSVTSADTSATRSSGYVVVSDDEPFGL